MDFWGTVVVLFRRWYVTLTAFALAVGVTLVVYASIPTTYVSTAVLLLTTPATGGSLPSNPKRPNSLTNPLLNFDKGLNMSASIVVTALQTPEMAAKLGVTPTGDPTFTVNNGSDNPELLIQSPFVFITGESTSPNSARNIVTRVMVAAKEVLADQQKTLDAPLKTYITMDDTVQPTTPLPQHGRKLRAAAVAMALGLVASLCAAFAAESIAQSRQARKTSRTSATTQTPEKLPMDDRQPVQR
jgi:hypothetical protein